MRLDIHGLTHTYPDSHTPVIKNLCFSMESPGFNAIFGPSGVGKSTLARIISAQQAHTRESIRVENISTILYSYNLERLPGWATTGKHLDRVTPEEKEVLKKELVDIFQLKPLLDQRFAALSMGQQNRVNLIRYLVQDFDLLIMDESLANVDEALRQEIILAIKALFTTQMFLYISHNLIEVATYCRQILVLGQSPDAGNAALVNGQDHTRDRRLDKSGRDKTMLEVMNAV